MELLKKIKTNKGIATLEILIAMVIIILAISAVALLVSGSQDSQVGSQTNQEALYKAQQQIETARATARNDFDSLSSQPSSPDPSGSITYNKSLTVTDIDSFTKQITSLVQWGSKKVTLSTQVTDWKGAAGSCNPSLSSSEKDRWKNPKITTFEFGKDLLGDASSGFPITDTQVIGKKLYVSVNNTNGNNNGTFFAFRLTSDPTDQPVPLYNLDNALTVSEGLAAIAISGHYAYVANAYTGSSASCSSGSNCSQLQVIDLKNPTSPVAYLKIAATTTGGKLSYGKSIFYKDGYIYLGLSPATGIGTEFNVIDVGAGVKGGSPTSPQFVKGYKVGDSVNSVYVDDDYAYLAVPKAGNDNENLTVLNIGNPLLGISRAYGYAPTGGSDGKSVKVFDGKIYLGRTFSASADKELYILNAPNSTFVASKDIGTDNTTTVYGIVVKDSLAFVITKEKFQIWDTSGGITQYATPLDLPGGKGTAIKCTGKYIYVGSLPISDKGYLSIVRPGPVNPSLPDINIHNSAHTSINNIVYGDTIHASASVSGSVGTATGPVVFSYHSNNTCTAQIASLGNIPLVGGIADPSNNTSALNVGSYWFKASYIGDYNYNPADSSCAQLTVSKVTPTITWSNPSTITYGTALSGTQLNATSGGVLGTFTYTPSSGTILNAGNNQILSVQFTPTDTANYNTPAPKTVTINVNKATPTISVTNSPVTYNGTQKVAIISASVAGSVTNIKYNGSSTAPTNASTYVVTADFVPTSSANYNSLSDASAGNFIINKATPIITWANPSAITYGTALSGTQLNATSGEVLGTFTYTPSSGTILNVGNNQTLSVQFTPTNTANYNTPDPKMVTINVNKAAPGITTIIKPSSSVTVGTIVHDEATVTGVSGGVQPTGTVTFTLYKNNSCATTPGNQVLQTDSNMPLNSGLALSENFTTKNSNKPSVSYLAQYNGDSNYNSVTAMCQPLTVN